MKILPTFIFIFGMIEIKSGVKKSQYKRLQYLSQKTQKALQMPKTSKYYVANQLRVIPDIVMQNKGIIQKDVELQEVYEMK